MRRHLAAVAAALLLITGIRSHAVVFYSTGSAAFNTTAPTGELAGSGWQFQGQWQSNLGTPIAPNFFISAEHLGGTVGDTFTFSGSAYVTTALFDDPNSDLRIWQVSGTFNTYAPLFTDSDETGKDVVFFGRGQQRGTEVELSGTARGWQWGIGDGLMRWGENQVVGIYDGGDLYGDSLLGMTFDVSANPNEATYSSGDSGGGVFILDGGVWKLAGINSWADGPYGLEDTPVDTFFGSIYDQDGFYADTLTGWQPVTGPGFVFASRISSSQEWIASVIPEPSAYTLLGLGFLGLFVRRRSLGVLAAVIGLVAFPVTSRAVIVYGANGTGTNNTSAPVNDPGWLNVGSIELTGSNPASAVYLGNYGGSYWMITANHVSLSSGQVTLNNGITYSITGTATQVGTADLKLFRISADPGLATLTISSTTSTPSAGSEVVMIGAGKGQGTPTTWTVSGSTWTSPGPDASGYVWSSSNVMRWGTDTIQDTNLTVSGMTTFATVFNNTANPNEATASRGDSGGAVFYDNGGTWELAGIMALVGNWTGTGGSYGGSYTGQPSNTSLYYADTGNPGAGSATFSVQLSAYKDQIMQIVPEPSTAALTSVFGLGVLLFSKRRKR